MVFLLLLFASTILGILFYQVKKSIAIPVLLLWPFALFSINYFFVTLETEVLDSAPMTELAFIFGAVPMATVGVISYFISATLAHKK
jgi:hypothetical protein